jgi:hypothetical protein
MHEAASSGRQKCLLWNRCLVDLDRKHPFLYQSPRNFQKVACALDVTETAGQPSWPGVSVHRCRFLAYRAQAPPARNASDFVYPGVDYPLSIKYIFVKLTAPWTTFGISLFKQILCGGELESVTIPPRARPAVFS